MIDPTVRSVPVLLPWAPVVPVVLTILALRGLPAPDQIRSVDYR